MLAVRGDLGEVAALFMFPIAGLDQGKVAIPLVDAIGLIMSCFLVFLLLLTVDGGLLFHVVLDTRFMTPSFLLLPVRW